MLFPSCRRKGDRWYVAMNKWQDITNMEVNQGAVLSLVDFIRRVFLPVLLACSVHFNRILEYFITVLQVRKHTNPLRLQDFLFYSEFLIHAADVEGLCKGIDEELVTSKFYFSFLSYVYNIRNTELGEWVTIPATYAGGAKGA